MATFTLRRFSTPEALKAIHDTRLLELLGRHADYFKRRGVDLASFNGSGIDYKGIVSVLMSPDESTPKALVDDLYFVHEMATQEGMDSLLAAIAELPEDEQDDIDFPDGVTPGDLAVLVRLKAPELLERKHAECFLTSRRSFEYFQTDRKQPKRFKMPDRKTVEQLEGALADRFAEMKRGRSAKVFIFPKDDEVWFLVRRGDTCRREGAIEASGSSSVYYRPECYDVMKYDLVAADLSINAGGNKKICTLYREKIGLHVFGDASYFPGKSKYTLEPLRADGEASLVCSDIDGIDWIRLKELHYYWGGAENEVEVRKATDIFAVRRGRSIPAKVRLGQAKFEVKFADSKTPRTVTIRPSNAASYTRDQDAAYIEQWLDRRGFCAKAVETKTNARATETVAHT